MAFALNAVTCASLAASAQSDLLEMKNTIINLLDALVEQGVLTQEKADELKREAQAKAEEDVAKLAADQDAVEDKALAMREEGSTGKVVRVPYVPEFVKDEIREELRSELKQDVVADVAAKAKDEKWGTPDALPDWLSRIELFGDFRLRTQVDLYDDGNAGPPDDPQVFLDFLAVNQRGGITRSDEVLFNFVENQERLRARFRLGLKATMTDDLVIGARLSTGNADEPLSMNQTLGDDFRRKDFLVDRAFFEWQFDIPWQDDFLTLLGGRMARPFVGTELIWDPDLNLDGVAAEVQYEFDGLFGFNRGGFGGSRVFLNAGVFPIELDEIRIPDGSSNDKWLSSLQIGFEQFFDHQTSFRIALGGFDYTNIVGRFNDRSLIDPGSTLTDWTAPGYLQKGNTLFPIKVNEFNDPTLFGLASDYALLDLTAQANFGYFAPVYVTLTGDIVKNLAYDEDEIFRRIGRRVSERSLGYMFRFDVGHPDVLEWGQWRVFGMYKYLQRDAVVDGFAESNFLGGGTNGEGFMVGALIGLTHRTHAQLRYWSVDNIDGFNENLQVNPDDTSLGVDIIQFDIQTLF